MAKKHIVFGTSYFYFSLFSLTPSELIYGSFLGHDPSVENHWVVYCIICRQDGKNMLLTILTPRNYTFKSSSIRFLIVVCEFFLCFVLPFFSLSIVFSLFFCVSSGNSEFLTARSITSLFIMC